MTCVDASRAVCQFTFNLNTRVIIAVPMDLESDFLAASLVVAVYYYTESEEEDAGQTMAWQGSSRYVSMSCR